MNLLVIALFLLAVILSGLAAFGTGRPRLHLGWAGAACGWLALLLSNWPGEVGD
jgi:hypothetical protein